MEPVARIRTEFPGKFGVPRQAGLVPELRGRVVFEPPFRSPEALRGMDGFSHLWLIWEFSENKEAGWSPTVRPNPIGLSCVKLEGVDLSTPDGPVLFVSGADLVDGTPILDIKPYLPYADCRPEAVGGFAGAAPEPCLAVDFPPALLERVPEGDRAALLGVLAQDPRPPYQRDPRRVYGFGFGGVEVRFTVGDGVLAVAEVRPRA